MSGSVAARVKRRADWKTVGLPDAAQIVNGGTPKSNVAKYWGGDIQWLSPKDMGRMETREIATTPRTISKDGLANSSARLVPSNSAILSTRAPIGHLAINKVPIAFNQGCRGIVPGTHLDHVYLYYFLEVNRKLLDELGAGTTFKELSATNLRAVRIPLPPLDEQKRIVAILDQASAALDGARRRYEQDLADLAALRQSLLQKAFAGELSWAARYIGAGIFSNDAIQQRRHSGAAAASSRRNPESSSPQRQDKSWIPGSTAKERRWPRNDDVVYWAAMRRSNLCWHPSPCRENPSPVN